MDDPSEHPSSGTIGGAGGPPGVPRWVKLLAAVVVGLVLVAVILQVTGVAGDHGPGRHGPRLHGSTGGAPPTVAFLR